MFFDTFSDLCKQSGVTPNKALVDCEISRTSVAKWKKGATPNGSTLTKIADYFGVTADYLLTGTEAETAPTLTKKDERDIEKQLESVLDALEGGQSDLAFSGEPLDEVTRELLVQSLRNSMEIGKTLAKQKFTPKKYRKD